ncbi:coiled-coil domain-containing protein 1 isoform X2 [Durio zibethinus]|uniref:Coiled-coil domain-containing protein 1 isoform X2 n=1 Tax=Durio zibethinus TaxID=66656 RepID=A0A6P5XBD8_DURZI|nr:coiled-coil domain-containing protein 1 isoform X2 [Durio zibethinus]
MSNRKKCSAATAVGSDEVEQLLQSAQDEVLLKLSVDSHMSRVAPDYLDPDLHRRFQALRSRPSSSQSKSHSLQQKQSSAAQPSKPRQEQKEEEKKERISKVAVVDNVDEELRGVLGDDLSARFAALKASLSSSSNPTPVAASTTNEVRIGLEKSNGDYDEEDEVEKVIQWAIDAARLDPSPPSDDDNDQIDSDSDDNDSDDDDDPKHKNKEPKSRK